ncbi:MAG TPA: hypothetical protein VI029_19610 [Mycobacterium sp.]
MLGVGDADRSAFGLVGVEQVSPTTPRDFPRQFPGQVVGIVHAGVESETAGRREAVRGVADQECASFAVSIGDLRRHRPALHQVDVDGQIPVSHRISDSPPAIVGGEVLETLNRREVGELEDEVIG